MERYAIIRDDRDYCEFFNTQEEAEETAVEYAGENHGYTYYVVKLLGETKCTKTWWISKTGYAS